MARSPFVPVEERASVMAPEQGAAGGGETNKGQEVLLVHSQVRRIKKEDEEIRERLLKLQLLEIRPLVARRVMRSLSPLRRAGNAIPVGD
ncbi:hypothetical protein QOZ80_6AG0534640 [Eleusine coracana subsp. coracana]|nr:hypothetical protein QOZ80_6AG0534640 [Eleusine coracana subsp. coracana]